VSRLQYATDIKLIRIMCTGRVDLSHVIRAFTNGKDGVLIGGCHLGDCHYDTGGNYHAAHMVELCKKLLGFVGIDPRRLRIAQMSAGEGLRFVQTVNDFSSQIKELGPLGEGEGITPEQLTERFEALNRLLPNVRLVERERLRVRFDTAEKYAEYFNSPDVERLLKDLVGDKLAVSLILTQLAKSASNAAELAEALGMSTSEVARHIGNSAKHGLVRYNEDDKRFRLAKAV